MDTNVVNRANVAENKVANPFMNETVNLKGTIDFEANAFVVNMISSKTRT